MLSLTWHRNIFLFGIIALVTGLLFGAAPTSISQAILLANWLLEKDFLRKWNQIKSNKLFWVLMSLFIIHLLGLFYTSDFTRGLEDIKTKLPLVIIPLVLFTTKPFNSSELKLIYRFFLLGIVGSTLYCFMVYAGFTHKTIIDVRQASVFMSHIRFSLIIAFAIIAFIYQIIHETNKSTKIGLMIVVLWLFFFMYKLEMVTGVICLLVTGVVLLFYLVISRASKLGFIILSILSIAGIFYVYLTVSKSISMYEPVRSNSANIIVDKTANNRNYYHDTTSQLAENGNLILVNINDEELKREWEKRSAINFDGLDNKKNFIKYTLYRFMASKGLRKDSVGVTKLSDLEIKHIEDDNTNFKFTSNSGLIIRWRELVWEYVSYTHGKNPSGHTLAMRIEFWKTGWYIAQHHFLFGVGTGDIQIEYNKAYQETNSQLTKEWQLRCHNQYLAILIAFGVGGLFVFLIYMFYPAWHLRSFLHPLFWPFLIIILLSYISEDTLETQAGVTFFILYYSLFLWLAEAKKSKQ